MSNGLDFCLPPKSVNREVVFAEFEISISAKELSSLKTRLSHSAHAYCGTPMDVGDFNMHKEHFQTIKSLRCNQHIPTTKPDKGSGVVILNKSDYIKKVSSILDSTGSQRPRMYGLPKKNKENIPLRPILSMIGSSQHELAKWLAEILAQVLKLYTSHCVKDSFTFANFIQNCNLEPAKTFLLFSHQQSVHKCPIR